MGVTAVQVESEGWATMIAVAAQAAAGSPRLTACLIADSVMDELLEQLHSAPAFLLGITVVRWNTDASCLIGRAVLMLWFMTGQDCREDSEIFLKTNRAVAGWCRFSQRAQRSACWHLPLTACAEQQ